MRSLLIKLATLILSALLFALFLIAAIPCFIISYIVDAYKEDKAVSHMHKEIETFLSKQRDGYDYEQIHTW